MSSNIIDKAKCATVEACVMCQCHVPKSARPKKDGCGKCHIGKLIEAIKAANGQGTTVGEGQTP